MSESEWTDATSYQRGERGARAPDAWEITINDIRIWIGSGHRYYPGTWIMHCFMLDIDSFPLAEVGDISVGEVMTKARQKAAAVARQRANKFLAFAREASPHHG